MKIGLFVLLVCFNIITCIEPPGSLILFFTQKYPIFRGRIDPIFQPGEVSHHSLIFSGGSGLISNASSNSEYYNILQKSKCTTSGVEVDKSVYFMSDVFYHWPNSSLSRVPSQLVVYYLAGKRDSKIEETYEPFPPGFRMVAGDADRKSFNSSLSYSTAIRYTCGGLYYKFPPTQKCVVQGMRAQVYFPSCWDGVNLDSADHTGHVVYPINFDNGNGVCPPSHPKRFLTIMLELMLEMNSFPHWEGFNSLRLSNGDATGYGLHAGFINGWDFPILQSTLNDSTCSTSISIQQVSNCSTLAPYLKLSNAPQTCVIDNPINNYEDTGITKVLHHLPGCNPISNGPTLTCSGSFAQSQVSPMIRVLIKSSLNNLFLIAPSRLDYVTASTSESQLSHMNVFNLVPVGPAEKYAIIAEGSNMYLKGEGSKGLRASEVSWNTFETWNITFTNGEAPTAAGMIGSLYAFSSSRFVQVLTTTQLQANGTTTFSSLSSKELFIFYDVNAGVLDTRVFGG